MAAEVLAYQQAQDGPAVFPPRLVEPGTGRPLEWKQSAGYGFVYATTVVHRRDAEPYNVSIVELDEGFRMMSRVDGLAPDKVRIGLQVRVRFVDGLPIFVPV